MFTFIKKKDTGEMGFCPSEMIRLYSNWIKLSEVSEDKRNLFCANPPEGKMLGADSKGNPCWIDIPNDELIEKAKIKKSQLMNETLTKLAQYDALNRAQQMAGNNETDAQGIMIKLGKYYTDLTLVDPTVIPCVFPTPPEI